MKDSLIITCEHAGNQVPKEYAFLFEGQEEILTSHRGWDPGASQIANFLSQRIGAPLFECFTTRLLIETNRSIDHHQLFSEFTDHLSLSEKENLIAHIYLPYRNLVQSTIENSNKPLLHLSIHSFTPVWNSHERKVDIGILFDPNRNSESAISQKLKDHLQFQLPTFKICFNEPYQGTDDGFTTCLREKYNGEAYSGIEIEVNQKFISNLSQIEEALYQSVLASINKFIN